MFPFKGVEDSLEVRLLPGVRRTGKPWVGQLSSTARSFGAVTQRVGMLGFSEVDWHRFGTWTTRASTTGRTIAARRRRRVRSGGAIAAV
ncbi:hypothetical protein GCM10009609_74590 [Pseudonocardia aurantiaca]